MTEIIHLVEATPRNPGVGLVTVRMVSARSHARDTVKNSQSWTPALTSAPLQTLKFLGDDQMPGILEIGYGALGIRFSPDLGNDVWSAYVWEGADTTIWRGESGAAFGDFEKIFTGRCGALERQNANIGSIALRGYEGDLDRDLLSSTYAGTGGAEGDLAMKGVSKPWMSGPCEGVPGVLIDKVNWIWQLHGYGAIDDITAAYEGGLTLGSAHATVPTTYAALAALSMGGASWAKAPAVGMVRLGYEPSRPVVFDARGAKDGSTYVSKVGAIASHLLKVAGFESGDINSTSAGNLDTAFAHDWGYYTAMQASIGDVVRKALADIGGYAFPDEAGIWRFGRYKAIKTATALKGDRSAAPIVRSVSQRASLSPIGRVEVGARRCWGVHREDEISPALLDALDKVDGIEAGATRNGYAGVHNSANTYTKGDIVILGDGTKSYIAKQDVPASILITNTAYWGILVEGSGGAAGEAGFSAILSNPAHVVATNTSGGAGDYSDAGGQMSIYEGATNRTGSATFAKVGAGTWYSINAAGVYTISDPGTDKATCQFDVTYGSVTLRLTYSIAKSKAGAGGAAAKAIKVTQSREVITYDGTGALAPTLQDTTLTAALQNSAATINWSATRMDGVAITPITNLLSAATGASVTMTAANFELRRGTTAGVVITASISDGGTFSDIVNVIKVQDGAAGDDGAPGMNNAVVTLYKRGATAPAKPTGTFTYTFATGVLSGGTPDGWTQALPASDGNPAWAIQATAASTAPTDTIAAAEFSTQVKVLEDGAPGTPGTPATSIEVSRKAVGLWAYANGTVVSFADAAGLLKVRSGNTDVTASATLSASASSGVTGTINTAANTPVSGQPKGYYRVTAMTGDTGTLTLTAVSGGVTLTETFSLVKQKGGYEIVGSLPGSDLFEGRVVYLTTDDKLYRYTGSAWTAGVPASDISGTIADAQIAAVAATKVTGQITATQITDGAVSTPKLAAGAVDAGKLAAGSVETANLAAGAVIADKLATNAVTAVKILAGAVETNKLAAGAVTAAKMSVTSLDAITAVIGTLRTATTGARLEIHSNVIKVYDASGVLRVQIGDLSL